MLPANEAVMSTDWKWEPEMPRLFFYPLIFMALSLRPHFLLNDDHEITLSYLLFIACGNFHIGFLLSVVLSCELCRGAFFLFSFFESLWYLTFLLNIHLIKDYLTCSHPDVKKQRFLTPFCIWYGCTRLMWTHLHHYECTRLLTFYKVRNSA